jgi:1-acyl-sn-glycerol-3-phosphate acyltransferase
MTPQTEGSAAPEESAQEGATSGVGKARVLTHKTLVYRICRTAVRLYLRLRHRMLVEGLECLPTDAGALIVANHQSVLDIPLIAASTPRHVAFVARKSLANSRLLGFVMRECGAVLIDRGAGDRGAMRVMVEHLRRGDLVTIFPEGTRTIDGRVGLFKGGALLAARKAGAPIVPASIRGSYAIWPRSRRFPGPGRLAVRYSSPMPAGGGEALVRVREVVASGVGEGAFESVPPS